MNGDTNANDFAAFTASLPGPLNLYAAQIRVAAWNANVSPWLLAGICWRESQGGASLKPPGPAGTGDFHPRPPGRTYNGYVVSLSGMPEDNAGWGRGLCQIDWGVHNLWCRTNKWDDAATNLAQAAELLAGFYAWFSRPRSPSGVFIDGWRLNGLKDARGVSLVTGWAQKYSLAGLGPYADPRALQGDQLTRAALAAYNAGQSGVLQALAAQLPADAPTAGNNYPSWILERVNAWEAAYSKMAISSS